MDGHTALGMIVENLKGDGWGRHTLLVPGLGYWICIPLGMWLTTIAAFGALCPAFLAPVQHFCECVGCWYSMRHDMVGDVGYGHRLSGGLIFVCLLFWLWLTLRALGHAQKLKIIPHFQPNWCFVQASPWFSSRRCVVVVERPYVHFALLRLGHSLRSAIK